MPEDSTAASRAREARPRNALVAALLSALVPGAGHLYLGHRRRGWVLIGITVAAAVPAVWWLAAAYLGDGLLDAALGLTPGQLILLVVASAALLGFRAFAVAEAYLLAGDPGSRRPARIAALAGVAALLLATAYPHLYVGERLLLAHDLTTHDFVNDPNQVALEDVTPPPGPAPRRSPARRPPPCRPPLRRPCPPPSPRRAG